MVSHIGSICEKCGSDNFKYITKGFEKRQIIATTCFAFAFIAVLSLFIGVFLAAILSVLTIGVGVFLALKSDPKNITYCNKCHSTETMHFIGSPKGRELYKQFYEKK